MSDLLQSTQTMTIASQPAGWTQTVTFAPFDPSLGTLVGTELLYSDSLTGVVSVENLDASPVTAGVTLSGADTVSARGSVAGYLDTTANASAPVASSATATLSPSGYNFTDIPLSVDASQPVSVTVSDQVATALTGGANMVATIAASAGATLELIYDYTPPDGVGEQTVDVVPPPMAPWVYVSAAETAKQVFTVADATTGWTQDLSVAQFDSSLGTLTSVDVTIIGDINATAGVENLSDTAATVATTQTATISITPPATDNVTSYSAAFAAPTVSTSGTLAAYDGTTDDGGTSGRDVGGLTNTATTSFSLSSLQNLADFTGTGTISVPLSAVGSGSASGGSALQATLSATAGATVEISYGYTPTASDPPACFASGTRIATSDGPVAVERLTVGDRVRAWFAEEASVVWIGHRRVDCARHPNPRAVWPVRVRAGAFGDGLPEGHLMLSPDHAVFADGVLIPVRYLMDGDAIAQLPVPEVEYWHVELAHHDVLFAEGLPAESFLAAGNRHAFANGGPKIDLHPDFAPRAWEAEGCAPLMVTGPLVAAVRARVAAISGSAVPRAPCRQASQARRPSPTARPGRIPARG